MKKRILSFLLALVMLVGMIPVQAFAADKSYVYVSFEAYDAAGNGRTLIKPERNERVKYTNDYALAAMRQAIGSNSDVKYDSDKLCITGVKDTSQSDGFLDNGDIEGYRWVVLRNNAEWDGTDYNTNYKLGDNEVLRCIYTNKTAAEISAVNKDAFIRYLSEAGESMWYESSTGYAEYMAALDVLVNLAATSADVKNVTDALIAALTVSAAAVEITQGEKLELGLNKSAALKATVTPSNTTDTAVWSSADDSIVSVNAATGEITGAAEGETYVTVTVGAVSDTIKIVVKPIAATAVSIKNGEAVSLEARASVQLEADVTPAGTTDIVSWSVADQSIAAVDENGLLTGKSAGQTTVTATAGNVSDTIQVTVTDTTVPYVYFEYADGHIQELENDTFTLTALDEGSFKVGNFDSKITWKCSDSITNKYNETEWRYWINSEGKFQPHGVKRMEASATGTGFTKTFAINVVSSGISEIKVSIGDTEVNSDNPYSVVGTSSAVISVQGLKNNQWIYIPTQAWMAESGNTNVARILGNQMEIIDEGQSDVTVAMVDNENTAVTFSVICGQIPVTAIEVHAPAAFVIDKWDGMGNGYVGIIAGYENPASEYYITFTPSNATNRNVVWINLTPDIAEFHELHGVGIVPKKAGTAKFRVTSESNPDAYQDVEIVFSFKTPLTNAAAAETSYTLEEGQTVDLDITVTPDHATEPRFVWTYSKEGVVKVTETVSADTSTRTITRKLSGLSTGVVTVTGTPIDDSANCAPIQFTVTVGDASEEDGADYLQIAKNDIAHGKAYLSGQNQTSFNNEWTIFSYLRSGGTIDAQKKIAYLQSVWDEIVNYGESLETLDYVRLILTLPLLGEDVTNFASSYNLVEALCNSFSGNQTSNMYSYGLLALDSLAYQIPDNSAWTREALIEKILTFQATDGGFGLGGNSSGSVDMTAIVLQALAPYNNGSYPAVQTAVTKALNYLKAQLTANAGFVAEGGENGCSTAQVLIALTALGIDPTNKDNGFTVGKSNLITNLDGFKLESGGFYWLEGNETVNVMGTQQITYAMEAYRRFALGLNPLYDLTDLNESGFSTCTVTLPEGEGYTAKICDGFASTVAKGGDFSFYIVLESGYDRSNMVVQAGNTILTADSYGVYTIKNIKADVEVTVTGVEKLDYTKLLTATVGEEVLDATYIGVKTYKTGNGTQYQNIPFYAVKLPVEAALTLTYNSTNPRAVLWMNYDNRSKENSGTYTFSAELLTGMYAMSSADFVAAFGDDTGVNTQNAVAFIEVATMAYNRLCCVLVEMVPQAPAETEIPLMVAVNGEAVEVTSLGEREYLSSSWKDPYTKPIYTVKIPAGADFVIDQNGNGDGASGADRVFARADGQSFDGKYPYTVTASNLKTFFNLSAEELMERVGNDTGLDTAKNLAFIEVKDSGYERMYVLLVEFEVAAEPDEPGGDEKPDVTIPITAQLHDGTALTVTVNGTQSVNGSDVPVLEIAIPAGTNYVKVIPNGDYRVYDCDGYWDENADNLSVIPYYGDFYTLTKDGGRTIDYVIKFAEAKEEEPPVETLPITAELLDGTALTVTVNGTQYVNGSDVPVLEIAIPKGTTHVKVIPSGDYRVYDDMGSWEENADELSVVPMFGDFYTLTADFGRTIDYVIKFAEIEEVPVVQYQVNLTEGTGFTLRATEGSTSPAEPGGSFSFTISINESFEKTADFAVKANGVKLEEVDGKYTISNIQKDQTVTVEGVVGKATTDILTVTANGENCNVVNTGITSYKQSIYGTITGVPVYKTSVPADTDFVVNWNLNKDGDDYSSTYRYAFAIDAGGDQSIKYYPFTMRTSVFDDYMLSTAQVNEFFGLDISSTNALFIEVYGGENREGDYNPLYGLLVELVVPKTTYTVNFTLLGDHKHADGEAEVHTLIDNNLEVWVAAKNYEVEPGATVLDLLNMVAAENNLTVGNPNGDYVKYITKDGVRLSEFTNGARSGWMYTINGGHSGLGVAEQKLADGDVIVFHYTDDYTRENSSVADLEAADAVVEKINAIGTVTLDSKEKIETARTAYDKLTAVQKALVGNYNKLTAAEQKLLELKDEAAANEVEKLINAIGTVTKDSGDKIKAARAAYDALTGNQRKLVENYKTLTDAESKFKDLNSTVSVTFTLLGCSKHGADQVHTLVDGNLSTWIAKKTYMVAPGATVKDVLEMALAAAGMSYKNPTGNYVESINGIGEFTNGSNSGWMYTLNGVHSGLGIAEQTVKEGDVIVFHYTDDYIKEKGGTATGEDTAVENVEALINAIGTATLNSKSKIDAARKAYDALSFTQKQEVENYKKLTDAETKYAQLQAADNEKKAETVENLIDAVMSGSSTFEEDVKAAQKAYNNLTADQKKLVDNYYKLADHLKDLADEGDKEAAKKVETHIDAIGAVTKNSEDAIKAARAAYDKLTDAQKALVKNYSELEDAEARWEDLQALVDVENIYKATGNYLKRLGTPVPGSVGGEWMVIGLIRAGNEIKDPGAYYDAVLKLIQENIDENGRLHNAKSTENARIILALTALGKDVTNVGGYNLLAGLNDMEYVQKQGINGPIWTLLALDSGNYPAPEGNVTREALVQVILDAQLADGGWALTGTVSDADITGMALQALASYYKTNAEVQQAVDEAIEALSVMQAADGSFASVDGGSSESIAQVIAALSALGIDADTDPRFIKNGVSALDALCAFFVEDGGFKHIRDGKLDGMATEQSYYALSAYFRMLEGKSALFDMTDVVDMGGDLAEEEPAETLPVPTEPAQSPAEEGRGFPWWLVIIIVVLAGSSVVLVIVSKSKKHKYVR